MPCLNHSGELTEASRPIEVKLVRWKAGRPLESGRSLGGVAAQEQASPEMLRILEASQDKNGPRSTWLGAG